MIRLLFILILIIGFVCVFVNFAKRKVNIDVKISDIDIKKFLGLLLKNEGVLDTELTINIQNDNTFPLLINRLYIELYSKGNLIAKSEKESNRIIIPANSIFEIKHNLYVFVTQAFFELINKLKSGESLLMDYVVKVRIFGFPVTFEKQFRYIKS